MITEAEPNASHRISQGDIYKNIDWVKRVTETDGIITVAKIRFPRIIVLTQDCDLNYDSESRGG